MVLTKTEGQKGRAVEEDRMMNTIELSYICLWGQIRVIDSEILRMP